MMASCYAEEFVNPASAHRPGQRARRRLEQLRAEIIEMLGGETKGRQTDKLVFTSGGTESNNLAIAGLVGDSNGRVLISAIEHPSVLGAAENLAHRGFRVEKIPVDQNGVCDLAALQRLLINDTTPVQLVCIMLANNETGVIQPIREIVAICHEKGALVHCDAIQGIAKTKFGFRDLGVDSIAITAHKFHGPRGIGGLLIGPDIKLQPILFGGFQQMGLRPGTEDVALAAGLHRALELFHENADQRIKRLTDLRDTLQTSILSELPDTVVNGGFAERVPHTLNLSFPGVNRQEFLMAADIQGLAISTGSACASGSSEPSHVLVAMGAPATVIEGSIRISLGVPTTDVEIAESACRIINIVNDLRQAK